MESLLKSVIAMLFAFTIPPENGVRASPCAEIQVGAAVVVLGSSVNASCLLREGCPLTAGRSVRVEWRLNGQVLAALPPANQSSRIFSVSVPSFSDTVGYLTCCVRQETKCQIVEGLEIRGGYPPSAPQNLTCLTNLTKPYTMTCKWEPGPETHLPTDYTLHTEIRQSKTEIKRRVYQLPKEQSFCTIPRGELFLFSEMRISVTSQNALGRASSDPLFLVPMEAAKFDPPVIVDVQVEPRKFRCLRLWWKLSEQQLWVMDNLAVEVRFRSRGSEVWTTKMKNIDMPDLQEALEQCGMLHGMEYHFQMRVRYGLGPWSEWGDSRTGSTLERAPSGTLDVWLKVLGAGSQTHRSVQLFWKLSKHFKTNGKNVSYHVFLLGFPDRGRQHTLCRTRELHCEATLPKGTRRVYIAALNSAGGSSPTAVPVYQLGVLEPVSDISVCSAGDKSLQVTWTRPLSPVVTGYVVEWGPLLQTDPRFLSFHLLDRNETSILISAGIESYRPYWISVYARSKNGISLPCTVQGYSLQKAPSAAPNLRVREIQHARAQLTWDDVPLEQRNGIIQSYAIFYWDEGGRTQVVLVKPTERSVTLTKLSPVSMYKAFIMASTEGGSVNGTIVTLKTAPADAWSDVFTVVPACLGLLLLFILTTLACFMNLACFTKPERLKMRFWPMIPDPANSSIKTWTEADMLLDIPAFQNVKDVQDPTPVHLSWFSLLDVLEGRPEKNGDEGPTTDDIWLQGGDAVKSGSSTGLPGDGEREPLRDVVPYATVVFASPYQSQAQPPSPTYLRSDSTQPLLGKESPSPKPYQNFHFQEGGRERERPQSDGGSSVFWEEFPLLSALNVNDAHSEA